MDKPLDQRKTIHLVIFMHGVERIDLKLSDLDKKYNRYDFPAMNKNPELQHTIFHPTDAGLLLYSREHDVDRGANLESTCGLTCKLLSKYGEFFGSKENWTANMDKSVEWHLTERPPQGESMSPNVDLIKKLRPIDSDIELKLQENLPLDPDAYKRNFVYDQRFSFGSDLESDSGFRNPSKGIFIVGHSNLDPGVREVVDKYKVKFDEGVDCCDTIAQYNMTDVDNYKNFRDDLIALGYRKDSLPNIKMGRYHGDPSKGPASVKINGKNHYNHFYLSHIIKDFTQFGNEHVNIMLYSCRGRIEERVKRIPFTDPLNMRTIEDQSKLEKARYQSLVDHGTPLVADYMQQTGVTDETAAANSVKEARSNLPLAVRRIKEAQDFDRRTKSMYEKLADADEKRKKSMKNVGHRGWGGTRKRKRRKGRKTKRRKNKHSIKRRSSTR